MRPPAPARRARGLLRRASQRWPASLPETAPPERRPFRDNRASPARHRRAVRSAGRDGGRRPFDRPQSEFLSEVGLYELSAADLTLVLALVFGRTNIVSSPRAAPRPAGIAVSAAGAGAARAHNLLRAVMSVAASLFAGLSCGSVNRCDESAPRPRLPGYYREHEAIVADATRTAAPFPRCNRSGGRGRVPQRHRWEVTRGGSRRAVTAAAGGAPVPLVSWSTVAAARPLRASATVWRRRIASGSRRCRCRSARSRR